MSAAIAKSLAKFHDLMRPIERDAINPFFSSRYSSLGNILASIKGPMQEAGLTFTQLPGDDGSLKTVVFDTETGENICGVMKVTPVKNDPQAHGSAMSYARRYSLVAILGLDTDGDDDGNEATKPGVPAVKLPGAAPKAVTPKAPLLAGYATCVTPGCGKSANLKYGAKCYVCNQKGKTKPVTTEEAVQTIDAFYQEQDAGPVPFD